MASLELKDGWFSLVFCAKTRTPGRKRVSLLTQDRRTATRLRTRLEAAFAEGRFDPWRDDPRTFDRPKETTGVDSQPATTMRAALGAFLASRSAVRPATLRAYGDALGPFVRSVGSDFAAAALAPEAVRAWWAGLTCSPTSRASYLARVRTFVRFLVGEGLLGADPTRGLARPTVPDRLGEKCMTEDHLARFVAAVDHRATPYLADLATVAFDLALRRSEAINMRAGWVDLERGVIRIATSDGFETKTGAAVVKPIPPRSLSILAGRCSGRPAGAFVFVTQRGTPIRCPRRLTRTWKTTARRAGLPESITPHAARHGGISRVAALASIEATRRFAGHSTVAMTMKYVHLHDDAYFAQVRQAQQR